jgi:hypothetical protein
MNKALFAGFATAAATAMISGFATPAEAFSFGNSGIKFDADTVVNFSFVESHGAYTSAVHIFEASNLKQSVAKLFWETKQSDNGGSNEWKGSFGNAVTSASGLNSASFTFKAGVEYTLGLLSGKNGTVYSTDSLNKTGTQQAVFGVENVLWSSLNKEKTNQFQQAGSFTSGNPFKDSVMISFDDRGNKNDKDFQDFTISATASEAVPEPLSMGGIALAGAGLAYVRRRSARNA